MAATIGLSCGLSLIEQDVNVETTFDPKRADSFNSFNSTSRIEAVEEFLKKEIDFEYYIEIGTIESHYPLHRGQSISSISQSFDHYRWKLPIGFLTGSYIKYMQPINIIKNYLGEKCAFEYSYLIHYQAYLCIPAVVGIIMTLVSVEKYADTQELKQSLDTTINGVFGLCTAIWATCFLESWKRKQRTI